MAARVAKHAGGHPSFVARIWLEPGEDGTLRWRGKVRHVQEDHEMYFGNLRELGDFLEAVSGVLGVVQGGERQRSQGHKDRQP